MASEIERLAQCAKECYSSRFGGSSTWLAAAPGRVNLIGEHIDYSDGFVLPMAIDRYTVIAAGPRPGTEAHLFSVAAQEEVSLPLPPRGPSQEHGHWSNYLAGVLAGWWESQGPCGGFQAVVESSVPLGGGLSSSASLEVAIATLLEGMTSTALAPIDKAILCQRAEHEYPGVPCGIMDQFASVFSRTDHLMLLDCRSREIEFIPLVDPDISVLIINSHVKHELTGGEYAERRAQCESVLRKLGIASMRDVTREILETHRNDLDEVEYRRARHAVTEIARTVEAASAIRNADWERAGELMFASHDSLRDDYEVSCGELDLLVGLAREIGAAGGVIGSRMTGGGFGGCTVSLVRTGQADDIAERIGREYRRRTSIEPGILMSRPARGAHLLQ